MLAGSLFSGIGGMDHGLARTGFRHSFFCESDAWRRSVLAARWPGVPIYDDVRAVGSEHAQGATGAGVELRSGGDLHTRGGAAGAPGEACGDLPGPIDLLCGGFPCQDLSVAGQRRGLAGDRSGLFHEFARIAGTLRPRWLLVENVPGLLSSNGGRDFGIVLGTLADLGYGLAWRIVDSRFFGVPQRRRRVFIVGALAVGDPRAAAERAGEVLAVGSRCGRHPATGGEATARAAVPFEDCSGNGRYVGALNGTKVAGGWRAGPDEAAVGQLIAAPLSHGSNPNSNIAGRTSVRRLTPIECERLQALPDGWTNPDGTAPDSRRYSALGDAVTSTVAEWVGRRIMEAGA